MDWINVGDILPDKYNTVLLCGHCTLSGENHISIGHLTIDGIFSHSNKASNSYAIKHWMQLPEPPIKDL